MLSIFIEYIQSSLQREIPETQFFSGQAWKSKGYGEIDPDGGGSGSEKLISQLSLSGGDKFEYVYDFGDDIQHVITLEKIAEPENEVEYPRIISIKR